ncbi:Uncharacterized protein TCM_020124 [Theobroma cacao]|uniref:RNase H type-1 domain-containing protein n=1 Tax=Theobroma cacao TaxID=3641 RepID=A0A061EJF6_THECC|nr:Uncharacterized protein TCM_020124 [Theobroma cacao]
MAKLLAAKEVVTVLAVSRWVSSHSLFLECDNCNVVNGLPTLKTSLGRLRKILMQICVILSKINKWVIEHIPHLANVEANSLAKQGVLRTSDFLWVNLVVA